MQPLYELKIYAWKKIGWSFPAIWLPIHGGLACSIMELHYFFCNLLKQLGAFVQGKLQLIFFIYILAGGTLCDPFCTPVTTCTQIVVTDTGSQGRLSITA